MRETPPLILTRRVDATRGEGEGDNDGRRKLEDGGREEGWAERGGESPSRSIFSTVVVRRTYKEFILDTLQKCMVSWIPVTRLSPGL